MATKTQHGERGRPEKRQQQALGAKKSVSSLTSCLISPKLRMLRLRGIGPWGPGRFWEH